jgi:hypothetical protein
VLTEKAKTWREQKKNERRSSLSMFWGDCAAIGSSIIASFIYANLKISGKQSVNPKDQTPWIFFKHTKFRNCVTFCHLLLVLGY